MTNKYVIGIDLGGTSIKGGAVSKKGVIQECGTHESASKSGPLRPVENMVRLVHDLSKKMGYPPEAIGFGIPGAIFSEKGIVTKSPHFPRWRNFNLKASLENKISIPFIIENDANAAALGEAWLGAGKGYKHFCCMTLGTGIGGGIVLNGSIWKGMNGMAGEIGHIVVEPDGRPCPCGGQGCLETYASATGIIKTATEKFSRSKITKALKKSPDKKQKKITAELLCKLAREGDETSKTIFKEMGKYLGIGFADLINILNLELIIIGGGLLPAWNLFIREAIRQMKKRAYKVPAENVQIVKAKCGNDAGLLGCAHLAWNKIISD